MPECPTRKRTRSGPSLYILLCPRRRKRTRGSVRRTPRSRARSWLEPRCQPSNSLRGRSRRSPPPLALMDALPFTLSASAKVSYWRSWTRILGTAALWSTFRIWSLMVTAGWFRELCHWSTYDMAGQRVFGPSPWPLYRLDVEGRGGGVYVDPEAITRGGSLRAEALRVRVRRSTAVPAVHPAASQQHPVNDPGGATIWRPSRGWPRRPRLLAAGAAQRA